MHQVLELHFTLKLSSVKCGKNMYVERTCCKHKMQKKKCVTQAKNVPKKSRPFSLSLPDDENKKKTLQVFICMTQETNYATHVARRPCGLVWMGVHFNGSQRMKRNFHREISIDKKFTFIPEDGRFCKDSALLVWCRIFPGFFGEITLSKLCYICWETFWCY